MLSRRGFFKTLALAGLLPFLPGRPDRRPDTAAARAVVLLETPVAGFQYHEGMRRDVFRRLRVNQRLLLAREPENPHDELAVAIRTEDGRKLGYLPRACNKIPAALADQAVPLHACITAIDPDAPPWERLYVKVWQEV